jgi:tetratricopeptide (TPR) repeat protein
MQQQRLARTDEGRRAAATLYRSLTEELQNEHLFSNGGGTVFVAPMHYACLKNLGVLCASVGDTEEAVQSFASALDLDTSDVSVWYKLATVAGKTGRLRLARYAYEQGLARQPAHLPSLLALPPLLEKLGDGPACEAARTNLLERDPALFQNLLSSKTKTRGWLGAEGVCLLFSGSRFQPFLVLLFLFLCPPPYLYLQGWVQQQQMKLGTLQGF